MDGCSKSLKVRYRLLQAKAQNKAYIPFTSDSLMLDVVDYYDRYGTNNEQIEAHYLLGCVYRDLGESPLAIDCYQKAAAKADIASADCDYRTLCRVYSQLAEIFYQQNLLDDNLRCLDQSIAYAYKAYDTIAAVNSYAQKLGAYEKRHLTDSIIAVSTRTFKHFTLLGYPEIGSRYLSMAVKGYTDKKDLENARHYMSIYEAHSGYLDSVGNIEKGREAYYNIKGRYYLAVGRLDSAEYFFRKELCMGSDYNNQNLASRDLSLLFKKKQISDSVAKYSLYSYEMNDSVYSQMVTTEIGRLQAIYDYSQHERIAQQERERTHQEREKKRVLIYIITGVGVLGSVFLQKQRQKRKVEHAAYQEKVCELERVQNDVLQLRTHETELGDLLLEKEEAMEVLIREIALLRQDIKIWEKDEDRLLMESPVYCLLLKKSDLGQELTKDDWRELSKLLIEVLPDFHQFVSSKMYALSANEYHVITLLRLHIKPAPISNLLGISRQYVTKLSRQILEKVFNCSGNTKDLAEKVLTIS
jgi:tetratricopeptide (TPR) repeat protein